MDESGKNIDLDRLEAHIREMRCKAVPPFKTGNTKSMYGEGYTDRGAALDVAMIIDIYRAEQTEVKAFYTPRRQATEQGRRQLRNEGAALWLVKALGRERPNRDLRAIREATGTLLTAIKNAGYVARGEIQERMRRHFGYRANIMPDPATALVEYLHGLAACAQTVEDRPVVIDQESADKDTPPAKALAQELVTLLRGHIGRVPQIGEMVKLAKIVGEKLGWAGEVIRAAHKELWPTEFMRLFRQEGIDPDQEPETTREAVLEKAVRAICLLDGGPRSREGSKNTYPPKEEIDKVRSTFWPPPRG